MEKDIHIIGGGLAGSECAVQLARKGHSVKLYEMRKANISTAAHKSQNFGELVCSNSFGSQTSYSAPGQLKWEAEKLNSFILETARQAQTPAGMALAVDRERFAESINQRVLEEPNIEVCDQLVTDWRHLEGYKVIATGPLTHPDLAKTLQDFLGKDFLYFFDAIAPIIDTDSINMDICFKANRFDEDSAGDYINCPFSKKEYFDFIEAIQNADKVEFKSFEKTNYFDGCMPIEAIVERGERSLRFGPLSPKGLFNPRYKKDELGHRPYAVLQLRQDNLEATAYNLVGCQTKMTYPEQKRVFRMVPGLEEAEFLKLGSIHRNMFINSPLTLNADLSAKADSSLFFAGQITGVEGYFESTCTGLLVAHFIDRRIKNLSQSPPPRASALGSLVQFLQEEKKNFQPTNCNFSLFPNLELDKKDFPNKSEYKRAKKDQMLLRAKSQILEWQKKL